MPNRRIRLVYALGILFLLSACEEGDSGSMVQGKKPCPKFSAELLPVTSNPETQNPVVTETGTLRASANRNTLWVVQVGEGAQGPVTANVSGLPGVTSVGPFNGQQSGILNATFSSTAEESLIPEDLDTVGLSVSVTDANGCVSDTGSQQVKVTTPFPKSVNWAPTQFAQTPSEPQILPGEDAVTILPSASGEEVVSHVPVPGFGGHQPQPL